MTARRDISACGGCEETATLVGAVINRPRSTSRDMPQKYKKSLFLAKISHSSSMRLQNAHTSAKMGVATDGSMPNI
jgi:hypothetical protein